MNTAPVAQSGINEFAILSCVDSLLFFPTVTLAFSRYTVTVRCMAAMHAPLFFSLACLLAAAVNAKVTIYGMFGQTTANPDALRTGTAALEPTTSFVTVPGPPHYTELAAYNPIYMLPPAIPNPPPPNQFAIGVPTSAQLMNGLSIPQKGSFFGFSIEMSVADQLSKSYLFC